MAAAGRAVILREPDDQYTLLIYAKASDVADEDLIVATPNITLASAFNTARDSLAAMATASGLVHKIVTITTRMT